MQDAESVISHAVTDVNKLAQVMELSTSRTYEILGKDNPYPKTKRLIRDIDASQSKQGVRLIKADMDALFCELLENDCQIVGAADLHKEAADVVQSVLTNSPKAEQKQELRELIAVAQLKLNELEKEEIRRDLKAV